MDHEQISFSSVKEIDDNKALSYEEAVAELEDIVKKLERGEAKLEESGKLYERGINLARYCSKILNSMEEKMTQISQGADGIIEENNLEIS